MSTRCNILVTGGTFKMWIYRHHDGYAGGTGYDLGQMLKRAPQFQESGDWRATGFANRLVTTMYDATDYCAARQQYEITDAQHGDIEYLYHIHFHHHLGIPQITVYVRPSGAGMDSDYGDWPTPVKDGTVAQLRAYAARDKREMNRRWFARKRGEKMPAPKIKPVATVACDAAPNLKLVESKPKAAAKVEKATYYGLTETAKLIRRCLKEAFPGIKFSVRSERASMCTSINVRWTDGPLASAVDELIGRFQYAGSMRIDDYQHSRDHALDGKPVKFGVKYISCSREVSGTVRQAVNSLDDQEMKAAARKIGMQEYPYDTNEDGSLRWRDEYAGRLAHNVPIWKGRQQPCAFAESIAITGEH